MNILKEYDGTGAVLGTYVHGPGIDQPISMTRGGQTYYYHADGLGSITGLTNSSQTVVQNYGYDGFGNLNQTPTVQNPYTYTGREWDAETGLYYYRARYYDPKVGRFLQQDPIGVAGGVNTYVYVGDNPLQFVDPLGLWSVTFGGYLGLGGEVSFGRDANTGGGFMTFRRGYGFGGGFSWQPNGTRPGSQPGECNTGGVGVGVFGDLGFNFGPLQAGLESNAGVNNNTVNGPHFYGQSFSPSWGVGSSWGIKAGGAFGGEGTIYSPNDSLIKF